MSANQARAFSKVPLRDSRYYGYTVAEGIANSVAEMLAETIGEQDPALVAMLNEELRIVREWIIGNRTHPKKIFDKLQEIRQQIAEFQHRGVENAAEKLHEQAAEFADVVAQHEAGLLDKLLKEREIRRRTLKTSLTDTEIKNMLNYKPFVDGRTIGQWFSKLEFDNASAIFNAVQKGVVDGMTLNSIMQVIQGRQTPQGWESGILDRNRRSAETLARTVINATANQSRLEMYQANADVIDGVQWQSTLDHRTCMICGAYDGKIWTPDKMSEVKVPPAHPSCRCVLLPYIDIDLGGTRPAEAENFDLMAKEKYEAKYEGKKYDDLSYEYRRKLRYKAIEEYSQSGKEPYKQVPSGATFADYLKGQPDEFQREWLGARRYELYKAGKLDVKDLVKPNSGFKRTVEDLKVEFGEKTEWRDGWSDSFWEKVDEIKGYNLSKEIVVSPEILQAMKEHGFRNVDEFADKINEYVKSHDVLHRFRLRDILQQLADEPILKNQFETGTTNSGFFSPEGRKRLENVISGSKSDDMLPRERPVYGYVSDVKKTVKPAKGYGDTTVVFKNSVRNRMTFTIGNSSSEQGAFYDDVRAIFNKGRNTGMESRPRFIELAADIIKGKQESHSPEWYLESQIWGSADLRQDVSEIAIGDKDLQHLANNVELGTWQQFKKQMDSANVKLVYYTDWTDEFIQKNSADWENLKKNVGKLGLSFVRIAR